MSTMKKIIPILAAFALTLAVAACHKAPKEDPIPAVAGEWELTAITKSVPYAGQTVDVYIAFQSEGGFELYQMIGQ